MNRRTVGAGLIIGATALACSEFAPDSGTPAQGSERLDVGGEVEVFSWWTSGGEREAFEALVAAHRERVPSAEVTNAAVDFADKAREQLALRFSQGEPPDTFQANSGADLLSWVETGGKADHGSLLERLDDLAEALSWEDVIAPELYDSLTYNGHVYGVPSNVHRINSIFYRKDIFLELGLTVPKTLDGLLEFCKMVHETKAIQTASPTGEMACLALGNQWNWTMSMVTFEMIFPAIAGAEGYESYFRGDKTALYEPLEEALNVAMTLYCGGKVAPGCLSRTYFNRDVNTQTWDQGVRKLTEGTSLLAPMGDWAKGFLESEAGGSLEAGVDFDVAPFPGSESIFVFTADAFTLPKGAPNRDGARSFLRTIASVDGQIAFNRAKGSIPARTDISPDHFDSVTQNTMHAFEDATKVRALSGLLAGVARDSLHPELSASLKAESLEIIKRSLVANYPFE